MITVDIVGEQITIDRDGEKITDLGEIVKVLDDLARIAKSLWTINTGLAKLQGSRLDYLTQMAATTTKPKEGQI